MDKVPWSVQKVLAKSGTNLILFEAGKPLLIPHFLITPEPFFLPHHQVQMLDQSWAMTGKSLATF